MLHVFFGFSVDGNLEMDTTVPDMTNRLYQDGSETWRQ